MIKPLFTKGMWLLGLLAMLGGVSQAAVTSDPLNLTASHGNVLYAPLTVHSDQPVAGLNGELVYDSTVFNTPQLLPTSGTNAQFNLLGNEPTVGHYKFVIYSDPVTPLDLATPVAYIALDLKPTFRAATLSTLVFNSAAAGDPNGASLGATLASIQVQVSEAQNAARNWSLYE